MRKADLPPAQRAALRILVRKGKLVRCVAGYDAGATNYIANSTIYALEKRGYARIKPMPKKRDEATPTKKGRDLAAKLNEETKQIVKFHLRER